MARGRLIESPADVPILWSASGSMSLTLRVSVFATPGNQLVSLHKLLDRLDRGDPCRPSGGPLGCPGGLNIEGHSIWVLLSGLGVVALGN
eukprot:9305531-Pyramimonas_sp.AAC.1